MEAGLSACGGQRGQGSGDVTLGSGDGAKACEVFPAIPPGGEPEGARC